MTKVFYKCILESKNWTASRILVRILQRLDQQIISRKHYVTILSLCGYNFEFDLRLKLQCWIWKFQISKFYLAKRISQTFSNSCVQNWRNISTRAFSNQKIQKHHELNSLQDQISKSFRIIIARTQSFSWFVVKNWRRIFYRIFCMRILKPKHFLHHE